MTKKTSDLPDLKVKCTKSVKNRYLKALTSTGRKGTSAYAAGVCPQTIRDHMKIDPQFAQECENAMELYRDYLEEEIHRRAVTGFAEPVFQGGKRVLQPVLNAKGEVKTDRKGQVILEPAMIRKFSDKLLELHAKRHIPEYRDRATLDVNAGGVLVVPGQQRERDWSESYSGGDDVIEGKVVDEKKHIARGS